MLKRLVFKLGQHPQRSWRSFKLGLCLFVVGATLIIAGANYLMWLQIPGLLILIVAVVLAAKGYIGIAAYRFAQVLNRAPPPSIFDK